MLGVAKGYDGYLDNLIVPGFYYFSVKDDDTKKPTGLIGASKWFYVLVWGQLRGDLEQIAFQNGGLSAGAVFVRNRTIREGVFAFDNWCKYTGVRL